MKLTDEARIILDNIINNGEFNKYVDVKLVPVDNKATVSAYLYYSYKRLFKHIRDMGIRFTPSMFKQYEEEWRQSHVKYN